MADGISVMVWVARLKQRDPEAARQLWEIYSQRMLQLARTRLRNRPQAAFDEEDIAISAFDSFCRAVQKGRYFSSDEPQNLWALLATFTVRKLNDQLKIEGAVKRNGDSPEVDDDVLNSSAIEELPTSDQGPVSNVILAEEYRRLFGLLKDPELEQLAVLKLEGHTNDEIAQQLGYTRRTIQRMLNLIRSLWQNEQ